MKIGILTYHRSHNYGALLQAIALRHKLEELGHKVYFIDYWPKYHQQIYDFFSKEEALKKGIKGAIKYIANILITYRKRKERIVLFNHFISKYIAPYCLNFSNDEKYDIIIYGSDQIWRKQPQPLNYFNPIYFAENTLSTKSHISYAASMGDIELNEKDYAYLKKTIHNFNQIAVRENDLKDILLKMGIKSKVVVDPTLLLQQNDWNTLLPIKRKIKEKYVLYYRLHRNIFNEKNAFDFAQRNGCKLIILDGKVRINKKGIITNANPTDFLSLIKNAEYVLTSSYHGLIFSIIFNKEFYASFATNIGRAKSILTALDLEERLISPNDIIPLNQNRINYNIVNEKLESLREESLKYLTEIK